MALARASRAAGDMVTLGRTLINLAMLDIRLGDPLSAASMLEEARSLAAAAGDIEAEENALGQLATALSAMGQPQRALAALDTAANLAEAHGLRRQVAEDWKLLGDLFAEAGDDRRALAYYARSQQLNAELGLVENQATRAPTKPGATSLSDTPTLRPRGRGGLSIFTARGASVEASSRTASFWQRSSLIGAIGRRPPPCWPGRKPSRRTSARPSRGLA